jgi:hypothetical protein
MDDDFFDLSLTNKVVLITNTRSIVPQGTRDVLVLPSCARHLHRKIDCELLITKNGNCYELTISKIGEV